MPFDRPFFEELRGLSEQQLDNTRARGIDGYVPNVGEVCQAGHLSNRFLRETESFVRRMDTTPRYRFNTIFRAYPQHVTAFPHGRAFHQQWNVALTACENPADDFVRIGIGGFGYQSTSRPRAS